MSEFRESMAVGLLDQMAVALLYHVGHLFVLAQHCIGAVESQKHRLCRLAQRHSKNRLSCMEAIFCIYRFSRSQSVQAKRATKIMTRPRAGR